MSSKNKRILIILLAVFGILILGAAAAWYAVVPGIIHAKLEEAFTAAEQKTGRKIALGDVRLRSLRHLTLNDLTIADKDSKQPAITVDQVDLYLAGIPGIAEPRLADVKVNDVQITFNYKDGHHNFEDLLALVKTTDRENGDEDDEKTPPAWKRYITPLPDISVNDVQIAMPSLPLVASTSLTALNAKNIAVSTESRDAKKVIKLTATAGFTLDEKGTKNEYASTLSAEMMGKSEGALTLTMPRNKANAIPELLKVADYAIETQTLTWTLPTTLTFDQPRIAKGDTTLFAAERANIRLMALPPKKVSGVYFKEIDLKKPVVNMTLNDEGNDLTAFAKALKSAFIPPKHDGDAVDSDADARQRDIKDYYFSQRFYVSDASFHLHDARKAARADYKMEHLNLESGYRSIRKIVDLRVTGEMTSPLKTAWTLDGIYNMKNEDFQATLDVPTFNATPETKAMREKIRTYLRDGEPVPRTKLNLTPLERILAFFEMDNASARGHLTINGNVAAQSASLETAFSTKGFSIVSDIISTEPLSLDSEVKLKANVAAKPYPSLTIAECEITRDLAKVLFNGTFAKEHMVRQRTGKLAGTTEYDTWRYDLALQLPDQAAQTVFDAIPHAMRTELDGLQARGNIAFKLTAKGRLDDIDATQHKFDLTTSDDFGVFAWPANRDLMALNTGFLFHVNDPNALLPHDIVIPASTHQVTVFDRVRRVMTDTYLPKQTADDVRIRFPNWVLFEDLNPWLVQLITTTEDGSFFTHAGFSPLQIKAALARNVERGEFYRGASTISMQLIKNLFFDRNKTLARKGQEALYTWLMESILHIPKQRIMEIYFNIIEFGPEIYGIEEAAKYYFGKRSDALTLNEAAFLIAIIPGPRKGELYRTQGVVSKALQKTMNFYIREMYRRKCTPEMLAQMRARFEKRKMPVPFEPCCPSAASIELMQQQPITFYVPDPRDPLKYDFDPALYLPDGTPLIPVQRSCGYTQQAADSELGDIFGVYDANN